MITFFRRNATPSNYYWRANCSYKLMKLPSSFLRRARYERSTLKTIRIIEKGCLLLLINLTAIYSGSVRAGSLPGKIAQLQKSGVLSIQMSNKLSNLISNSQTENQGGSRLRLENDFLKSLQKENSQLRYNDGGVATGGGSIITTTDGRHGLIDFFTHAPDLFSRPEYHPRLRVPKMTNFDSSGPGVSKVDLKILGAWDALASKIAAWEKSSPLMTPYLKAAISNLPIYFVNYEIKIIDQRYFIPENLKKEISSLNTVALYRRDMGLVISKPEFEELPYDDQIGLLMKEILRHIQITYNGNMSSEEMQSLNVAIIKGPQNGETLDSVKYLPSKVIGRLLDEGLLEIFMANLSKDVCQYATGKQLDLCPLDLNNKTISDLIRNLTSLLEIEENSSDQLELRTLLSRSFRLLDWGTRNNLTYIGDAEVADAIQGLSFKKLKLDAFISTNTDRP